MTPPGPAPRQPNTFPPLADRHSHVSLYAALRQAPSLSAVHSRDEALEFFSRFPSDTVTVAIGWHGGRYTFSRAELDAFPPLVLVNVSLHGLLINRSAEERLAPDYPDIAGHWGNQAWCERHLPDILVFLTRTAKVDPHRLSEFMADMERLGIERLEDMLAPDDAFLDLVHSSPFRERIRCWASPGVVRSLRPDNRKRLAGVKIFTDGALGTRTAAISGGYLDGAQGLLVHSDKALHAELQAAAELAPAVAVHAIGDLALEQALGALEAIQRDGGAQPAVRLEHAQFITVEQARRARQLGATLCMQPNFSRDSLDYADRLTAAQRRANNPFRLLIDKAGFTPGRDLLFGSDGMPHGLEAALEASLAPPVEGQRLSEEEFVSGYTAW